MKLGHLGCAVSLALAAASFSACNNDDNNDDAEAPAQNTTGEGVPKDPQEQIYLQNVTADKPLLVVYGDSISTGVLANTNLGQNIDNGLLVQLGNYIKAGEYNANGFQTNLANQPLAASTTENDYGLRSAIAAKAGLTPAEIGVVSFAKFGAKAVDIPEMLSRWNQEETNTIKRKPDYILVALGGNDFCSDMTVEDISRTFNEQIDAIQKSAPDAQLIISPAPPVYQLAAIDFTYGPAFSAITGEELSCKKFREQACKRVYDADAQARLEGINQGIQAAFDAQKAKGAKVSLASGVLEWKITSEELAFDCFHPSQKGQTTLGNYWKQALPQ
ncbi:MAG TPA: SGNH/GDSL hydrolase family protein [Oligoflexus sp.]|uniref:SGNH/GDSL hydrolase family protein n=1 Tax=Oligoflexus sp. TaxID=1971216 RepID=UPI002D2D4CAE|nr:SGNH/GDSL hydrolase family protein [Oligoflexus sp.]HYX38247.1 SGNH/GDSL hydrolase family protein [Oligoflexus sp.]